MKLKVKTQDERLFLIDVNPNSQIRQVKAEVQALDGTFDANKYRILFQGRFLEDDNVLQTAGVEDDHTVLLVPKPVNTRRSERASSSNNAVGRTHPSLRRFPPEVIRFLQAQQTVFAMIQAQRRDRESGGTDDDELDAMESQQQQQQMLENVVDVRECDSSELLLGFAIGFLLGPIAGLCLIENALSRHLRAGMLMGIICEVVVALFRMATHIPKGV